MQGLSNQEHSRAYIEGMICYHKHVYSYMQLPGISNCIHD